MKGLQLSIRHFEVIIIAFFKNLILDAHPFIMLQVAGGSVIEMPGLPDIDSLFKDVASTGCDGRCSDGNHCPLLACMLLLGDPLLLIDPQVEVPQRIVHAIKQNRQALCALHSLQI